MADSQAETVAALVAAARDGDESAWRALVDRFSPLAFGVVRAFGLSQADQEEVISTMWLRLVENLDRLREPRALPGWIKATTKNEALRVLNLRKRSFVHDPQDAEEEWQVEDSLELDERLLAAERHHALREAMESLAPRERALMQMFLVDPPLSYAEIGRRTGLPVGSIGPTRGRCLLKLRRSAALRPFDDDGESGRI